MGYCFSRKKNNQTWKWKCAWRRRAATNRLGPLSRCQHTQHTNPVRMNWLRMLNSFKLLFIFRRALDGCHRMNNTFIEWKHKAGKIRWMKMAFILRFSRSPIRLGNGNWRKTTTNIVDSNWPAKFTVRKHAMSTETNSEFTENLSPNCRPGWRFSAPFQANSHRRLCCDLHFPPRREWKQRKNVKRRIKKKKMKFPADKSSSDSVWFSFLSPEIYLVEWNSAMSENSKCMNNVEWNIIIQYSDSICKPSAVASYVRQNYFVE